MAALDPSECKDAGGYMSDGSTSDEGLVCKARAGFGRFSGGIGCERPEAGEAGFSPDAYVGAGCGRADPPSGSLSNPLDLKCSPTTRPSAGEFCVRDLTSSVPDP